MTAHSSGKTFGVRLREYRLRRALTQRQLAALVNLDFSYLSKIEGGKVPPPSREGIAALARALRLTEPERDELFALGGRVSDDIQRVVVNQPGARQLLRSIQKLSPTQQAEQLAKMIEDLHKEEGES